MRISVFFKTKIKKIRYTYVRNVLEIKHVFHLCFKCLFQTVLAPICSRLIFTVFYIFPSYKILILSHNEMASIKFIFTYLRLDK